jgi:hypothetical protein
VPTPELEDVDNIWLEMRSECRRSDFCDGEDEVAAVLGVDSTLGDICLVGDGDVDLSGGAEAGMT